MKMLSWLVFYNYCRYFLFCFLLAGANQIECYLGILLTKPISHVFTFPEPYVYIYNNNTYIIKKESCTYMIWRVLHSHQPQYQIQGFLFTAALSSAMAVMNRSSSKVNVSTRSSNSRANIVIKIF